MNARTSTTWAVTQYLRRLPKFGANLSADDVIKAVKAKYKVTARRSTVYGVRHLLNKEKMASLQEKAAELPESKPNAARIAALEKAVVIREEAIKVLNQKLRTADSAIRDLERTVRLAKEEAEEAEEAAKRSQDKEGEATNLFIQEKRLREEFTQQVQSQLNTAKSEAETARLNSMGYLRDKETLRAFVTDLLVNIIRGQ